MSAAMRAAAGAVAISALVLVQNLFGPQLNALFLALPGIDKLLHFAGYFAVFVGLHWLLQPVVSQAHLRAAASAAAAVLLSLVDEALQSMAPGRSVELNDLIAGWAGVTFGWAVAYRPRRRIALAASIAAIAIAGYQAVDTRSRLLDYATALRYEGQHDFVQARAHYLKAVASGLRTPGVLNGLSWVTIESGVGDYQEALSYARAAHQMAPGDPDILDTYGWALHKAGRSGEALGYLQRAYRAKPDMFCIHYHLGEAYLATGERGLAEEHLRRQVELRGTREAAMAARTLAGVVSSR